VLRRLEVFESTPGGASLAAQSAEDRIEAAVAMRRADASHTQTLPETAAAAAAGTNGAARRGADPMEDLIASRKRAREESAAGFCPKCGKPFQKSDKFCSKCGKVL
jgi:hypothetical protein